MSAYVVYWNNIPSPYMVDRFNALADRRSFEFEAWFNERLEPDRSWVVDEATWRFRHRYLPATRLLGRTLHWPLPLLGRRPDLLVSLYHEPSFVAGWAIARARGIKTGFRVLRTYDRWVARTPAKDFIKRLLFQRVDGIETPGAEGKDFAVRYGAHPDRIFFATHTVDIGHFSRVVSQALLDREGARRALGLIGTTFIYVGRLWWGKGVQQLLEAFGDVQRQSTAETSLLFVGDGPEENALKLLAQERGIRNVSFVGFRQTQQLPRYYALADVFVFPTLGDPYGIVVDEAMACGLPVISTSAAGEIRSRVDEGINGYVVPPENRSALAERMLALVHDRDLREQMGRVSRQKVQNNTPERWAEQFEHMVRALLCDDRPSRADHKPPRPA